MATNFWAKMDALQLWHSQLTDKSYLQPLKPTRWVVVLIILAGIIAAGLNGYVRWWQYEVWEQNSQVFYLDDGTPLFTTTDAPYFLGLAQAIKRDGNFQTFNEKRQHPLTKDIYKENPPETNLRDAPLLSVVLSIMASNSSTKSLLVAGHRLIPVTAILTALMIVFAFGSAGYWLEGSIAAAGGGLSLSYLQRTGAGRIDTDQLNLGFFYLITGLVIWAARAKSYRASLVIAALAGVVFWLFDWWNSRLFFGWSALIGLFWLSLVSQRDVKRTLILVLIFGGISGIFYKGFGFSLTSAYLADDISYNGFTFPNTLATITEIRTVPFSEMLTRISGSVWLGVISVFGLLLWGLRHPALAIVFGPAAVFALLNFAIGNRTIFYSAPMLWFGFGWLLILTFRWADQFLNQPLSQIAVLPVAVMLGLASVWGASPTSVLQAPTFDKQTVANFQKLDALVPASDAVVASWWDYGYMSMLINGKPTLHDGGSQTSPTTHFIANNLLRRSQKEAALELKMLGNTGYAEVIAHRLKNKESRAKAGADDTVIYLVLTEDMTQWMPSISKIGAFDIKAGKPYQFDGVKQGYQLFYDNLKCTPTDSNQEFICNGNRLNLVSGQLGNNAILDGMVMSKDGRQTGGRKFSNANIPFVLQSEVGAAANRNLLLHRDLYFSVFHQLFYLNRADPKYFELVYDDFPDMRVFKVL